MAISLKKFKKDIQELADIDSVKRKLETLEKEHAKTVSEIKTLRKEVAEISKKLSGIGPGGERVKKPQLIEIIEEFARTNEQPVKIVDLREQLAKDKRVKTKADNFYSVIATAMNNSQKFEKIAPGVYRYMGEI